MARPVSSGLLYFPFDTDFFSDKKIKAVRTHFGADGIALYIYLLCEIYRGNGYYIVVDDDLIDNAAFDLGLSEGKTRQIVTFFCRRSLFDDKLLTTDTVLSAKSIQRRYQEALKRLKRDVFVDGKLWLLEKSETLGFVKVRPISDKSGENPDKSGINSDKSGENPVKESKVNKSKSKSKSKVKESKQTPAGAAVAAAAVAAKFNSICSSFDPVETKTMPPALQENIKRAAATLKQQDMTFEQLFEMVEASDFLTGRSSKHWNGCSFGWILNPKNLEKILSGNYQNGGKSKEQEEKSSFDLKEIEEAVTMKYRKESYE